MGLELKGNVTGTVKKYWVQADATNDGQNPFVKIDILLDEAEAKALGGKLFAQACFSDFVGKSGAVCIKSKKLDGELKIDTEHTIEMDGYSVSVKPAIANIVPSADTRAVSVQLKIPIPGRAKKLRTNLEQSCGAEMELHILGVTQTQVPGTEAE